MTSATSYDEGFFDGVSSSKCEIEDLSNLNEIMSNEISDLNDSVSVYRENISELQQTVDKLNNLIESHVDNLHLFMSEKEEFKKEVQHLHMEIAIMKRKYKDVSIT